MATQEQLQQFGNTSSGTSSDSEESNEELIPVKPKQPKLKLKLRLSLKDDTKTQPLVQSQAVLSRSLGQTSMSNSLSTKPSESKIVLADPVRSNDAMVLNATVVEDDEEIDDMTVVAEPILSSFANNSGRNVQGKKRQSVRPIKMPAIASPGLMLPNSTTTAALFDHHMSLAGYSLEIRNENPHRGSSTLRTVDDMFDTNVQYYLSFPRLVPQELIQDLPTSKTDKQITPKLFQFLSKGLSQESTLSETAKRRFHDMIPLSLKIDYPGESIEKRQRYLQKVMDREAAIVDAQEAELEDNPPIPIPPIPEPPSPPMLKENQQGLDLKNQHPYYPPNNEAFVKHLDPNCFNSRDGRYLGLSSNSLADPHFVGAHAVGIQNLSVTAGTGLATTQTGSTSAGSASLASTVYGDRSKAEIKPSNSATIESNDHSSNSIAIKQGDVGTETPKNKAIPKKKIPLSPSPVSIKSGSAAELKRIMEAETAETEAMRICIIRAGVYASRTGRHGQSFLGPDGNTYPDVSKTFASYAGVKPCSRCKNNKQGAYHCRLRRKHKEMDYDGGDSPSILAPLFDENLENLILKKKI
jgi:hypothetical protein